MTARQLHDVLISFLGASLPLALLVFVICLIELSPLFVLTCIRWWAIGFQEKRKMLCTTCGHEGLLGKKLKGHLIIELVCWLLLLIPGLIYSTWRWVARAYRCPICEATHMIPASSPEGLALSKERRLRVSG